MHGATGGGWAGTSAAEATQRNVNLIAVLAQTLLDGDKATHTGHDTTRQGTARHSREAIVCSRWLASF